MCRADSNDREAETMVTKCGDCQYKSICRLDLRKRMHNGKCYIDELIERIKATPYKILDICYNIEADIWMEVYVLMQKQRNLVQL